MIPTGTKGIIFDMDGVLWLSNRIHAQAFSQVLAANRLPEVDYRFLAGRRTDQIFRELLRDQGRHYSEQEVQRLTQQKQALARELLMANPPVDPQCSEVILALSRRMKVALASSASRAGVALFLQVSGLAPVFSVVLCGDDVQRAKPDPEIYLLALAKLGLCAREALVVEDSIHGVQAAIQAGIPVIVKNGAIPLDIPKTPDIHAFIDRLRELVHDA
ncbi:MAG: HAD family phosphatase [Magnetococcales bacterium]|nr:HAD family phosphatase [Magnetococcales bacterium]